MEREKQTLAACAPPAFAHAVGQRVNVRWMARVAFDYAQRHVGVAPCGFPKCFRAAFRGAVSRLREEGDSDNAGAALLFQGAEGAFERGVAVAHCAYNAEFTRRVSGKRALNPFGHALVFNHEGRTCGRPNLLVFCTGLVGARGQDKGMQNGQPQCMGNAHHVLIGKELGQVRLNIFGLWGIGGARVQEDHANAVVASVVAHALSFSVNALLCFRASG